MEKPHFQRKGISQKIKSIRWDKKSVIFASLLTLGICAIKINSVYAQQNMSYVNTNTISNEKTLDKIKRTGKIVIGNRKDVVPLSYINDNHPIGYSIDICQEVVNKIKEKVGNPNLQVEYVTIDGKTRIPFIKQGKIDLECGSTTNNASRRKEVAFSIPYYISGVRILTTQDENINTLNDLRDKRIVVGAGTTSVDIINKANTQRALNISPIIEKDYTTALNDVVNKKADAFVLDDLLLFGIRSTIPNPKKYPIVGDFLSVEPLAIMMRKDDPEIKSITDQTMIELINSGRINQYYKKWFESPIPPKNQTLNIPQSPLLKDVFRMPTDLVGN